MTLVSHFLMAFILFGLVAAIGIGVVITFFGKSNLDPDSLDQPWRRDPPA